MDCTYGENAWQQNATLTLLETNDPLSLGNFVLIEGYTPSYNNFADLDRILQTITHIAASFDRNFKKVPNIAIGGKHGNACGTAVGDNTISVLQKMLSGFMNPYFTLYQISKIM